MITELIKSAIRSCIIRSTGPIAVIIIDHNVAVIHAAVPLRRIRSIMMKKKPNDGETEAFPTTESIRNNCIEIVQCFEAFHTIKCGDIWWTTFSIAFARLNICQGYYETARHCYITIKVLCASRNFDLLTSIIEIDSVSIRPLLS